jgi:hypothetical protein
MRRETQNPLISSQILCPFAEQSSLQSGETFLGPWLVLLFAGVVSYREARIQGMHCMQCHLTGHQRNLGFGIHTTIIW